MGFAVVETTTDVISGIKVKKIVMQSESELLCYHQALALQKITYNSWCDTEEIKYDVVCKGYLSDYLNN